MSHQPYIVISPCRNETDYMDRTLDSMARQTVKPKKWIIVDDGSTDDTPQKLAAFADKHPWVHIVTRQDRGHRAVGPGVIDAFYCGFRAIGDQDYAFLSKLDLDLELPDRYYETLLERMAHDSRLGTCSGTPYIETSSAPKPEGAAFDMSAGMAKFYRRTCFEQIGGLIRGVMWDAIDCHKCRTLGWKACAFDDDDALQFLHLRPMGSSQKGIMTGRSRHGKGQYFMGTGLVYMAVSALNRLRYPPYVTGGLTMFWGYLTALLSGSQRFECEGFRPFLRRYHWRILTQGRRRAVEVTEAEMLTVWQPELSGTISVDLIGSE